MAGSVRVGAPLSDNALVSELASSGVDVATVAFNVLVVLYAELHQGASAKNCQKSQGLDPKASLAPSRGDGLSISCLSGTSCESLRCGVPSRSPEFRTVFERYALHALMDGDWKDQLSLHRTCSRTPDRAAFALRPPLLRSTAKPAGVERRPIQVRAARPESAFGGSG